MSGHSRWSNIQHRKNRQDSKRAKIWTKIIHEISVATRIGGINSDSNPRLRIALNKAADFNMPKNNIQRAIQRGLGKIDDINYEEIRYEGYTPGGGAVIVDCLTDNRSRTISNVKYSFTKFGGKFGQDGSVSFLFKHCGHFVFNKSISEMEVIEIALDSGAEDIYLNQENCVEVICSIEDYEHIQEEFRKLGLKIKDEGIVMKPLIEMNLTDQDTTKTKMLLESLDNLEDVQAIYTNVLKI